MVKQADLPEPLLRRASELAGRSSDWWRQVGAIAWRGEQILGAAWNHHCPTEYAPYTDGDPRDGFSRGVRADLSTAIHAEASVVAAAARDGVPLDGADLYVTTFPCPACARLIAESGFRRCYFSGAYSVLDGDAVLRAAGVELLWVDAGGEPGATTRRGRELNRIRTGTSGSASGSPTSTCACTWAMVAPVKLQLPLRTPSP